MVTTATLSAAVIALILFLIIRQINRQNREAQERLEAERLRLDTALNNMIQGLILYDADGADRHLQPPLSDMFGLSTDVIKPGCHIHDAMQHRKERDPFAATSKRFAPTSCGTSPRARSPQDHGIAQRPRLPGHQHAAGAGRMGRHDRGDHRAAQSGTGRDRNYTFLREIIDHIPSQITVKDARDAAICWSTGPPRSNSASRVTSSSARPLRPVSGGTARIVTEDDGKALQSAGGCSRTSIAWQSRPWEALHHLDRIGIRDKSGEPRYLINVVEDVTERRRADEKIAHLAHYDALTDLPNRMLFREQIERELEKSRGEQFALLYIDVDEFKGIDDSLGHHVGDELLKAVAGRIRGCIREAT